APQPLDVPQRGMARAADGDSLRLEGVRIRLVGIDAPELDQVCWDGQGREWTCGLSSRARLAQVLEGSVVECLPQGHDRYGRVLARCEASGRDLGALQVAEGWALADGDYGAEERRARAGKAGIWRGRFVDPRQWRREGPSAAPEPGFFEAIWRWFRELTGATTLR
ncbi:thermonuclease family protein, partial [Devosia sp.]|uniref:thermonuclease family protein n=1 Tax=Devosia sp. TaxID=1871048 RepID=UPI002EE9556D